MRSAETAEFDDVKVSVNTNEFYLAGPNYYVNRGSDLASDAISAGRITAEEVDRIGIYSTSAARDGEVGVNYAVDTGKAAVKAAGIDPGAISVAAHSWVYDQGHEIWSPSHYVAHEIGLVNATPINVYHVSNGGALSIDVVHSWLSAHDETHGLVTTGERFDLPRFDRWASSEGVAYGDGGTAVLVSREPRPWTLRVKALAHTSAPQLERMHRGNDALGAHSCSDARVDVGRLKDEFFGEQSKKEFASARHRYVRALVSAAIEAASGTVVDETYLPRIGKPAFGQYDRTVSEATGVSARFTADTTGHLGSGDLIANLADFESRSNARSALFLSAGAGFTWTALVVERMHS
ncbi:MULTISPECIES: ketoacyl-ACP synthase III family protein [Rhodococcus]|uniref:ketoacyl-ACP synthase III family protein n=1 Tax=Rhodococcus TaxID=1827 RepID=UPI001C588845|nr:ketoacyl-ACP synthase III family protein [Rhodococcus sp. LW-XY12]QXU55585.1 ketoacyl-ACP synthase III family protein [Rhodococcus sp. LW-XY12]